MQIEEGKIVSGTVTGITNFGAFVELENGQTGLVHISEISTSYVKDINDHVKVGDTVEVKVLPSDKKGKIGLSIKQVMIEKNPDAQKGSPHREKRQRQSPRLPETDLHAKPMEFDWSSNDEENLSFEDVFLKPSGPFLASPADILTCDFLFSPVCKKKTSML
mgnify:CR=1 FL=1